MKVESRGRSQESKVEISLVQVARTVVQAQPAVGVAGLVFQFFKVSPPFSQPPDWVVSFCISVTDLPQQSPVSLAMGLNTLQSCHFLLAVVPNSMARVGSSEQEYSGVLWQKYTFALTQGPSIQPQIPVWYPFKQKSFNFFPLKEDTYPSISKQQQTFMPSCQSARLKVLSLVQKHTFMSEYLLAAPFQSSLELLPTYRIRSMKQSFSSTQLQVLMSYSVFWSQLRESPVLQKSVALTSWPVLSTLLLTEQKSSISNINTSFFVVPVTIYTPSHCLFVYPNLSLQPLRAIPPASGLYVVPPRSQNVMGKLSSTGPASPNPMHAPRITSSANLIRQYMSRCITQKTFQMRNFTRTYFQYFNLFFVRMKIS